MILQDRHSWPMLAQELPLLHVRLHVGQRNSPNTLSSPWCGVFCGTTPGRSDNSNSSVVASVCVSVRKVAKCVKSIVCVGERKQYLRTHSCLPILSQTCSEILSSVMTILLLVARFIYTLLLYIHSVALYTLCSRY